MGKVTTDKERIKRLFRMCGVNLTTKTYKNIMLFLEMFKNIRRDMRNIVVREGDAAIRENAPEMFRAMIESEEISRERVGDFVEELMSFRWLQEYIEDTLEEIQSFSINGETYSEILTLLYLGDKVYDSEVVKDMVGYCHSTFHNKKKISILLFGVLFWKKMLTHWNNSIEAMYAIEIQEGRDGSISERRKTITDRRCGVPDRRKGDRRVMGDRRVLPTGCI